MTNLPTHLLLSKNASHNNQEMTRCRADWDIGSKSAALQSFAMQETSKQELLRRAAKLVGPDNLAQALKVPAHLLQAWMDGHATVPARKLAALADYMEEITLPPKQ